MKVSDDESFYMVPVAYVVMFLILGVALKAYAGSLYGWPFALAPLLMFTVLMVAWVVAMGVGFLVVKGGQWLWSLVSKEPAKAGSKDDIEV